MGLIHREILEGQRYPSHEWTEDDTRPGDTPGSRPRGCVICNVSREDHESDENDDPGKIGLRESFQP